MLGMRGADVVDDAAAVEESPVPEGVADSVVALIAV